MADHCQAFECARRILEFSNGSSALYKLSEDNLTFFADCFLPCLFGWTQWDKKDSNRLLKLGSLLREVEKHGIHFAAIDDFPSGLSNHEYFLLFYAFYVLKEYEREKQPDKNRNARLDRVAKQLERFTGRIYEGFLEDKDIRRKRNKKKPGRIPTQFDKLYQTIKDYYADDGNPEKEERRRPEKEERKKPEREERKKPVRPINEDQLLPPPNTKIQSQFKGYSVFFLVILTAGLIIGSIDFLNRNPDYFSYRSSRQEAPQTEEKTNSIMEFFRNLFRKAPEKKPVNDNDSDGFTNDQEHIFGTDPDDPLSHPDYIAQIRVAAVFFGRVPGLKLAHIDKEDTLKRNWVAIFSFSDDPSDIKKIHINDSFKAGSQEFQLVDMEKDVQTDESIAYLRRIGSEKRIRCHVGQPIWYPSEVELLNTLNGTKFLTYPDATFKLGTAETGEEEYKVLSVDPDKQQIIVLTLEDTIDPLHWEITGQAAISFQKELSDGERLLRTIELRRKEREKAEELEKERLEKEREENRKNENPSFIGNTVRKRNADTALGLLKKADIPDGSCIYFAIAKDEKSLAFAKMNAEGKIEIVGETDETEFPYALLSSPKAITLFAKEETILFYEDPTDFDDGINIVFADGSTKYLKGSFVSHTEAMKAAARAFGLSAGITAMLERKAAAFDGKEIAPREDADSKQASDGDNDGFTLEQERKSGTDPEDPLSHPKYLTQITVSDISSFMEVKLISVDMSKSSKTDWIAAFLINDAVKINVPRGAAFSFNGEVFRLADFDTDKDTGKTVACIQTPGKEIHTCPLHEERRFMVPKYVKLFNKLNSLFLFPAVGQTFKLGTARTGEEEYKVISGDTKTKEVIVESVSDSEHDKFALLPE